MTKLKRKVMAWIVAVCMIVTSIGYLPVTTILAEENNMTTNNQSGYYFD